jgi:hypothetical protein
MKGEFSVYQFLLDDLSERVREFVSAEEALNAFQHYTTCVGAKLGIVQRVIITDGGDCINMEWKYGKGITFPPPPIKPKPEEIN